MSILSQFKQSQNTDFPNVRPSLDLRFALAKKLDPRITFTRGSIGTYFGSDGLMRTAGVNEPRFDHDPITGQSLGLLIEKSRSNLVAYSDAITTSNLYAGVSSTLIQVTTTTPISGLVIATKVFLNIGANAGNSQNGFNFGTFSLTNSTTYTQSIFVKASGSSVFRLRSNVTGQVFDIPIAGPTPTPTGTITSCTVTPYPDGWSRISWTFTSTTSTPGNRGDHWAMKPNVADGSSGFLVTGAQVEEGAFATSYIPTVASTVTRSADNASMTGTNFSSWYNSTEGTLYANAKSNGNTTQITGIAAINNSSSPTTNRVDLRYHQGGNSQNTFNGVGGGGSSIFRTSGFSLTNPKFVVSYASQNVNFCVNSSLISSRASAFVPSPLVNRLLIGNFDSGTSFYLNGTISRLTYYPIQLTNQQLINLCS